MGAIFAFSASSSCLTEQLEFSSSSCLGTNCDEDGNWCIVLVATLLTIDYRPITSGYRVYTSQFRIKKTSESVGAYG
jgi:hypothetical protein